MTECRAIWAGFCLPSSLLLMAVVHLAIADPDTHRESRMANFGLQRGPIGLQKAQTKQGWEGQSEKLRLQHSEQNSRYSDWIASWLRSAQELKAEIECPSSL